MSAIRYPRSRFRACRTLVIIRPATTSSTTLIATCAAEQEISQLAIAIVRLDLVWVPCKAGARAANAMHAKAATAMA